LNETPAELRDKSRSARLALVKSVHTIVWAFFAIAIVLIEVAALACNGWRCPLSPIAARYTDDRRDNFDIYLPGWLAGRTMPIFGTLYVAGILLTLLMWASQAFS